MSSCLLSGSCSLWLEERIATRGTGQKVALNLLRIKPQNLRVLHVWIDIVAPTVSEVVAGDF